MKGIRISFRLTLFAFIFSLLFSTLPKANTGENYNIIFSNTEPIAINSSPALAAPTRANLYPSNINVSGMTGNISRVEVSLRGLTHQRIADLDFLLVGPGEQKFIFLSDAPNADFATAFDGVYRFADDAPLNVQNGGSFNPGFYKPVNFGANDTFPAPAPAGPYNSTTFANNFNGTSPNGTWSLYVVDDLLGFAGSINSGWELIITTDGDPQTFANANYIGLEETNVRAEPYPSTINVSGLSGVVSNLRVTLNGITHTETRDIDILLVSPNGRSFVIMSDVGNGGASNVSLTFDDAAPTNLPSTPLSSGTFKPTNISFTQPPDYFPAPAPLGPHFDSGLGLSRFNNFSPNGNWQLYVVDDSPNNNGTIAGGWSLEITTAPPVPLPAGCALPSLAPANYATGAGPTNLATGDFNNDGKADLVVTNQLTNDISILLNDGSGGFSPQTPLMSGGTNPYDVAVGLFNNDKNQDLAVINSGSNSVSIFLGNGNGTFSAPTNFVTGPSPISIDIGDFNNDSKIDLAVANFGGFFSGSVSLLFGNGSGGFSLPSTLVTSTQPAFVKTANLNGDSNLDLVVVNFGANAVSVYFGNGTGGFVLSQLLTTGPMIGPVAVEIANVVGNSRLDLVVANYNGNSLTTFVGSANGTFASPSTTSNVGANPISVVAADIFGDGINRVAVALSATTNITLSTTVGFIGNFQQYTVGSNPNAIVRGDFNGDGRDDLATANYSSNNITVLTSSCIAANGNIFDFTGNRRTDISIYRPSGGLWATPALQFYYFGRDRDIIVPADYDGDLRTDYAIYRPENGLWFVTTRSHSSFTQGVTYFLQFGAPEDIPAPADYDGDGKADIAVFRPSNGTWYIRRSTDNGLTALAFGMSGDQPVSADYDGDGKDDIAVFRPSNGTWYILRSTQGFYGAAFGQAGDRTVQGDYDGDRKADIAVYREGTWYILRSSDNGFTAMSFGAAGDIPAPGDYDGDGKFDFTVFRPSTGIWYTTRSSDGGFQATVWGLAGDIPVPSAFSR